jgi:hypothetical protein
MAHEALPNRHSSPSQIGTAAPTDVDVEVRHAAPGQRVGKLAPHFNDGVGEGAAGGYPEDVQGEAGGHKLQWAGG